MKKKIDIKAYRIILWIIFAVYILILIKLTMFKNGLINVGINSFEREINLIPFKSTIEIICYLPTWRVIANIFGNVVIFIPFGFILPMVTRLRKSVCLLGLGLSLSIEIVQCITFLGYADIDDLIYNTLGTLMGFLLIEIIRRTAKSEEGFYRFSVVLIFILGLCGTIILIANGLIF